MIDHLVFASTDLADASAAITQALGIAPTPGGRHIDRGTHNELLGLGGTTYLEVIGPDPSQPRPDGPRPFGIDALTRPALVAWCVRPTRPLRDIVDDAARSGIVLGDVAAMSRRRPDGVLLEWELTLPQLDGPFGCALPFMIDWAASPHPANDLPGSVELVELEVIHPDPAALRLALEIIGVSGDATLVGGPTPSLRARLRTDPGDVTLSS
ncbi:MAG TPA: VOC family protein [Ilumatobacteraceae bacterium]